MKQEHSLLERAIKYLSKSDEQVKKELISNNIKVFTVECKRQIGLSKADIAIAKLDADLLRNRVEMLESGIKEAKYDLDVHNFSSYVGHLNSKESLKYSEEKQLDEKLNELKELEAQLKKKEELLKFLQS